MVGLLCGVLPETGWLEDPGWGPVLAQVAPEGDVRAINVALDKAFPRDWIRAVATDPAHRHPLYRLYLQYSGRFRLLELGLSLREVAESRTFYGRLQEPGEFDSAIAELMAGHVLHSSGAALSRVARDGPDWSASWDGLRLGVEVKRPRASRALDHSGVVSAAFVGALTQAISPLSTSLGLHIEVSPDLELLFAAARGRAPDLELAKSLGRETGQAVRSQLASTQSPGTYQIGRYGSFSVTEISDKPGYQLACAGVGSESAHELERVKGALMDAAMQIDKTEALGLIVLNLESGGVQPRALIGPLVRLLALDIEWTRNIVGVAMHSKTWLLQDVPYGIFNMIPGRRSDLMPSAFWSAFTRCAAAHLHFDPLRGAQPYLCGPDDD
jgi:hypothetical protein